MSRIMLPAVIVLTILAGTGCTPSATSTAPTTSATSPATLPSFELRIAPPDAGTSIDDTGPYAADAAATTNTCSKLDGGFWKLSYSGGEPYVRLTLLVGPEGAAGEPSDDVSFEIIIGSPLSTLINVDQRGYRSGDAPGRSRAVVEATSATDAITFTITATTPRAKPDFTDYPYAVDVELTATCPLRA